MRRSSSRSPTSTERSSAAPPSRSSRSRRFAGPPRVSARSARRPRRLGLRPAGPRERGRNVHLLGLVSYGGVHSHIDHLRALLELARREGMEERTFVHAFTDGRDVSPHAAVNDLAELSAERIATVSGRYYAMDRDGRWERTERALGAILAAEGLRADDPVAAVQASYDHGVTDEFVEPIVLA